MPTSDIYGGSDPRNRAVYSVPEAARYLGIPTATLAYWVRGGLRKYKDKKFDYDPIIHPPDPQTYRLSFLNLVEAFCLRALRTVHDVKMRDIRAAIDYAEQEYKIDRLLVSPALRTGASQVLLDRVSELVNLGKGGQLAMRKVLEAHLQRIDFDETLPFILFPMPKSPRQDLDRVIAINPRVQFGQPVLAKSAISTRVIAIRYGAGETEAEIAEDYDITVRDVEEAIIYEAAA